MREKLVGRWQLLTRELATAEKSVTPNMHGYSILGVTVTVGKLLHNDFLRCSITHLYDVETTMKCCSLLAIK